MTLNSLSCEKVQGCQPKNLEILEITKVAVFQLPQNIVKSGVLPIKLPSPPPPMLKNCQKYLQKMHFSVYLGDLVIYTRDWEFWSVSGILSDNMMNRILILHVKEKMREQETIFLFPIKTLSTTDIVPACCYEKDLQLFFLRNLSCQSSYRYFRLAFYFLWFPGWEICRGQSRLTISSCGFITQFCAC